MYPCCEVNNVDYAAFLRQRITELRMKINVSEYQMSLELYSRHQLWQGASFDGTVFQYLRLFQCYPHGIF